MLDDVSPLVTVAIPTRNRAALLGNAITSVLDQSMSSVELFVSDNASTDATRSVVESFGDPRIHYEPLAEDIGLFANLSRCLRLGTAPYVALLTDDDRMLRGSLRRRAAILDEHPEVDLVHSSFELAFMDPDGRIVQQDVLHVGGAADAIETGPAVVHRLLTEPYWINPAVALIRRTVVADERFDPDDGIVSDLGVSLRLARRCRAVAYVADPLSLVGVLADGDATTAGVYEFESGAFHASFDAVRQARRVKDRFMSQFPDDVSDVRATRSASHEWARDEVLRRLRLRWSQHLSPRAGLRLLLEATKAEPSILRTTRGARLLAGALAGRRGRAIVRSLRGFGPGRSVRVGSP